MLPNSPRKNPSPFDDTNDALIQQLYEALKVNDDETFIKLLDRINFNNNFSEAKYIMDAVIAKLKQVPVNANFWNLCHRLKLQYESLVHLAQSEPEHREELFTKAKIVKSQFANCVDLILINTFSDIKSIANLAGFYHKIQNYLQLIYSSDISLVFGNLFTLMQKKEADLVFPAQAYENNIKSTFATLEKIFNSHLYSPMLKLKLANQWLLLAKIILNNYLALKNLSPTIMIAILTIQRLILDLQIYKKEFDSLQKIILFFNPTFNPHLSIKSIAIETQNYLEQRNNFLRKENMLPESDDSAEIAAEVIIPILEELEQILSNFAEKDRNFIQEKAKLLIGRLGKKLYYYTICNPAHIERLLSNIANLYLKNFYNEALLLINITNGKIKFNQVDDIIRILILLRNSTMHAEEDLQKNPAILNKCLQSQAFIDTGIKNIRVINLNLALKNNSIATTFPLCQALSSQFDNLHMPHVAQLYLNLSQLLLDDVDVTIVIADQICGLIYRLISTFNLPEEIVITTLDHACCIIDWYLYKSLSQTTNTEELNHTQLQLLDLLLYLLRKLSSYGCNNYARQEDSAGNINIQLYPPLTWGSHLATNLLSKLAQSKKAAQLLESNPIDFSSCSFEAMDYCFHLIDYYHVAEVWKKWLLVSDIISNGNPLAEINFHISELTFAIHQFYHLSPLNVRQKLLYTQNFKSLIELIFPNLLNHKNMDCDAVLAMHSLLSEINDYQKKLQKIYDAELRKNVRTTNILTQGVSPYQENEDIELITTFRF